MAKCVMLKSGGITDVTVGGASVVADGVANVPYAGIGGKYGVVSFAYSKGIRVNSTGIVEFVPYPDKKVSERSDGYAILGSNINYAVKAAMCDGKGAVWTDAERIAAIERMGCAVGDDGTVKFTAQET